MQNAVAMLSIAGEIIKPSLIDTDILSMFFKGNENIKNKFDEYLSRHSYINFSIITYYEILSGLKYKDARKQMESFIDFSSKNNILPLTIESSRISARMYADLRKAGTPVDDIDLLIAGIALENNLIMVTNNTGHFGRIEGLTVENWSTKKSLKKRG